MDDESHRRFEIKTKEEEARNQLMKWAYETSSANMTLAERLEKSRWELERVERL
jgi:hypothetical protein